MDLDPNDGFPPFTLVTASSEASLTGCQEPGPADLSGCWCRQLIPVGGRELARIEVLLHSPGVMSASIPARVYRTDSDRRVDPAGRPVGEAVLSWTGGGSGWMAWDIHLSPLSGVKMGHYVRLELDLPPGIGWVASPQPDPALPGHIVDTADDAKQFHGVTFCFRVSPPQPCFWATNVLPEAPNRNRFTGTWRSNPADGLPQTLEANWRDPLWVEEVWLDFPDSPERPANYRIEVSAQQGPVHLQQVEANSKLHAVHRFNPAVLVDQVRLVFNTARNSPSVSLDRMQLRLARQDR
jgi:hypothetical protein